MNKILLITAAATALIMVSTSPAQIINIIETGAPLAIIIWLSPLLLAVGLYYLVKHNPDQEINSISLLGSKGGEAADTNLKEEENEPKNPNGFKFRITEIKQSNIG